MYSRRIFIGVLVLFFMLLLAVGLVRAQETEPPSKEDISLEDISLETLAPDTVVTQTISYQGLLKENGQPVQGTRNITFRLYSNPACTAQVGPNIVKNSVPVNAGLFSVSLDVNRSYFDGRSLWLSAVIGGVKISCQPILSTPYALSLIPGAIISGTNSGLADSIFSVQGGGADSFGGRIGMHVLWMAFGMYGWSDAPLGAGVYGTSSPTTGLNYGVYGDAYSEEGYGGYFINRNATYGVSLEAERLVGTGTALEARKSGSAGIAIKGINDGSSGTGIFGHSNEGFGVYASSNTNRAIYSYTSRPDNNYGLYTPDNIYSLNYHTSGSIMQVVQNAGQESLEVGDVVVFSGIAAAQKAGEQPVVQVALPQAAGSTAVAGVVYSRYNFEAMVEQATSDGSGSNALVDVTSTGPFAPGEYLLVVVHGPAKVKASAVSGAIAPGDLLSTAGLDGSAGKSLQVSIEGVSITAPGTVFGKALETVEQGAKLIYIYVTLQ